MTAALNVESALKRQYTYELVGTGLSKFKHKYMLLLWVRWRFDQEIKTDKLN